MKVFILLIFVFAAGASSAAAQVSDRERGIELFNQKKYAEAIEFFDKQIKAEGADVTSLFYLGQSFENLSKIDQAAENYTLCYQKGLLVLEKTFFDAAMDGGSIASNVEYVKNKIGTKIEFALKSTERLRIIEKNSAQNLYLQNAPLIFRYFLKEKQIISQNSPENSENRKLKITKKPSPSYTKEAIKNRTSGEVQLYVMFLSNGKTGIIIPKSFLPDDLTQRAIEAARELEFEPQTVNGEPVTVVRTLIYSFSL